MDTSQSWNKKLYFHFSLTRSYIHNVIIFITVRISRILYIGPKLISRSLASGYELFQLRHGSVAKVIKLRWWKFHLNHARLGYNVIIWTLWTDLIFFFLKTKLISSVFTFFDVHLRVVNMLLIRLKTCLKNYFCSCTLVCTFNKSYIKLKVLRNAASSRKYTWTKNYISHGN